MSFVSDLGRSLRLSRGRAGLSQKALAQRAQVTVMAINNLESGVGTVAPLLRALHVLGHRFAGQPIDLELGSWLAMRRMVLGLSQRDLAAKAGVSKQTISQLESGRGHIASLCTILGTLHVVPHLRPDSVGRIKSPLRYPGGKSKALKVIADQLPKSVDEYREPFAGGASTAFYVAARYPQASIWINDLYEPVATFWRVLADPRMATEMTRRLIWLRRTHPDAESTRRMFATMLEIVEDTDEDEIVRATSLYAINRCSFSGLGTAGAFSAEAAQQRWTNRQIEALRLYTPRMKGWRITSMDYERVIREPWKGSAPFGFLDPPYDIQHSKLYGRNGDAHRSFDHERLARMTREVGAKLLITYNDAPQIQRLYAEWERAPLKLRFSMRTHDGAYLEAARGRGEIILRNYVEV